MQTISANEAQTKLTSVMDMAQKQPIMIEREGQPALVLLSAEAYEGKSRKSREAFLALCDSMAKTSTERGMTEEILNSILSER